ncbi:hypothetical protein U8607_11100 [Methylobacterium durans]|uniref:hypothetical protein n=1 Tax=Methylobacterium durans TaxID=2202825 RepID=UPI002AFE4192|nr:hypothetical protein [Methylobacterium durans]MEA1832627.1 hypothetical protein [Methylobacterium durans]
MRKLAMAAGALALATAAFWSIILTSPPTSRAAIGPAPTQAETPTADHCIPFSVCQ